MSNGVLLAPHNDDEALFAAYTVLRHQPDVCVVLRCEPWPQRMQESAEGVALLGGRCLRQWGFLETDPDWTAIEKKMAELQGCRVWAPLPEPDGHPHHNMVGEIAGRVLADVTFYTTYNTTARTEGRLVIPEPGWEQRKLEALARYTSQERRIAAHLARGTDEYEA